MKNDLFVIFHKLFTAVCQTQNVKNNDLLVITKAIQIFEFDHMGQMRDEILLRKIVGKIKMLREQKGITLEEFYNDTNIHIARIESAHTNMTVSTLHAICKYLGISIQEFFKNL